MRCVIAAAAMGGLLALLVPAAPAAADIQISINKSAQRMSVMVDGQVRHTWRISTGLDGGPPSGVYRPQRLERYWRSRKYGWAPMPHSIFFHKGYAIHGTVHVSRLGRRASHGCVRLHPAHAATLFALVRGYGPERTRIVVGHGDAFAVAPDAAVAARSAPEQPKAAAARTGRGHAVVQARRRGEAVAQAKVHPRRSVPARAVPLMDLRGW